MSNEYIRKADAIDILDDFQAEIENGEGNYSWAKFKMNELELADVAPVVHGKWTKLFYDGFNCNKCGSTFVIMQGRNNMYYCPNCGAKMDREE